MELVKNKFEKLYDPEDCGWKDKPVIIPPWPSYLSVAFKPALLSALSYLLTWCTRPSSVPIQNDDISLSGKSNVVIAISLILSLLLLTNSIISF